MAAPAASDLPPSAVRKARSVTTRDKVILYALAAGRCSFRGCNDNIVEHHLTRESGNYGEAAHLYAFSEDGPRGGEAGRPDNPDTLDNLILLCPKCHKEVDEKPTKYSVADLRLHRAEHEARVRRAVDVDIEHKTMVVTLSAPVAGQQNAIPLATVMDAIHPRYLADAVFPIAHPLGPDEAPEAIRAASEQVTREFAVFLAAVERHGTPPISVFAIAPIPLLIHLGAQIGNKREALLFQLHRPSGWAWKTDGHPVNFTTAKVREGESGQIALLVNISGRNSVDRLPSDYAGATVYELAPVDVRPDRTLIRRSADLENFRAAYRDAVEMICRVHGNPAEVGVFPAVPIPFALVMGAELLPKADPTLAVHDLRKDRFVFIMRVNA